MSDEQVLEIAALVARYAQAAQRYEAAILQADSKEADHQHSIALRSFRELKRRGAEKEIVILLAHPSPMVRQWAAAEALVFAPEAAVQVLEELARDGKGIPKLDAQILLQLWRSGELPE